MREIRILKDGWRFIKTAESAEAALAAAGRGEAVSLPHTWNAVDGQDGGNDYYRGRCWYVRELTAEETAEAYLSDYPEDDQMTREYQFLQTR